MNGYLLVLAGLMLVVLVMAGGVVGLWYKAWRAGCLGRILDDLARTDVARRARRARETDASQDPCLWCWHRISRHHSHGCCQPGAFRDLFDLADPLAREEEEAWQARQHEADTWHRLDWP